jgi:hypothetical protein
MAERGKSVRAVGLSDKAYFLVCRWKAAWSERLGAPLSWAENLGTEEEPVLIHQELGGCWEPRFHAYRDRAVRQRAVVSLDRAFKVSVNGKLVWPWGD